MVVKVYVSGISGNKEVKKRQQKVLLILDSKKVTYEVLDIAEPNMEEAKEYMQNNSKLMGCTIGDPNPRHPLPPQIFNDDEYCGDYDAFDMANEIDEMEKFLKLAPGETASQEIHENGEIPDKVASKESSPAKEVDEAGDVSEKVASKEASPEKESNEETDISEKVASKEPSPAKDTDASDKLASKEQSPAKDTEESTVESEQAEEPVKEKSPSPQKEEAESGDNETDDQKAENATNGSKEEQEDDKAAEDDDEEETDKSEQV
ncbi:hypothetical protein GWI33_004720 [Rhynchophorus ferrugineus]|uniref:Uncharacterized protein n=1 Tax=Rhynchophorus ferrugineus TaxID=354439 RepID=A0A834MFB3_RHYFE|nr:hypothetical protein GWI33_004720 [Rhynchophorus ferrugineus]